MALKRLASNFKTVEMEALIKKAGAGIFGNTLGGDQTMPLKSVFKSVKKHSLSKIGYIKHGEQRLVGSPYMKMPAEIDARIPYHKDKIVMKKLDVLLKAGNTYQTPKK